MSEIRLLHPLVLASTSAARERMLREAGLHFSVIQPRVDEETLKQQLSSYPIAEQALALAKAKVASVAAIHAGWLVIGGDQICALGGEIISKPGSKAQAEAQLRLLSGKTHIQHSAGILMQGDKVLWETVEIAHLTMRTLGDAEIEGYVGLDKPYGSCGGYRYEAHGKHLFAKVEGTDDVIQGLPLQAFLAALYAKQLITMTP